MISLVLNCPGEQLTSLNLHWITKHIETLSYHPESARSVVQQSREGKTPLVPFLLVIREI